MCGGEVCRITSFVWGRFVMICLFCYWDLRFDRRLTHYGNISLVNYDTYVVLAGVCMRMCWAFRFDYTFLFYSGPHNEVEVFEVVLFRICY